MVHCERDLFIQNGKIVFDARCPYCSWFIMERVGEISKFIKSSV
jgi:hypothetical protein